MIQTLLFDMDGLLVDSEPWWKKAEKEVFGSLGLSLDDELLRQVMGFRLNEVVEYWYHYQPWPDPDFSKTEEAIIGCMEDFLKQSGKAMPGVENSLEFARRRGFRMGLASSSPMRLIETVVQKLNLTEYFSLLYSAEFEPYGKPHPGIFLSAARLLQTDPKSCLVLEDSVNGVIAAKAARMTCLAIPEPEKRNDPRFSIADCCLDSMLEFPSWLSTNIQEK